MQFHIKGGIFLRLLAIDGNSIMNRAFYGIKMLSNKKGMFTNAIYGFMNIYLKNFEEVGPDAVVCAFDLHAPTFRHKKVSYYKANRKGMPDELRQQMPVIKELLCDLGVTVLEREGFEADDILGTLSRICTDNNAECFLLTGDRDNLQLINGNVTVRLAATKETYVFTPEKFREEYHLEPIQLIDLKALMGDSSDNIPGVAGIGEKTASAIIGEYGSIEELYEKESEWGFTKSVTAKLQAGKDSAMESKWLATIVRDVPIPEELSAYKLKAPDKEKAAALLADLEIFSLIDRLKLTVPEAAAAVSAPAEEKPLEEKSLDGSTLDTIIKADKAIDYIFSGKDLELIFENTVYTAKEPELIARFLNSKTKKRTFAAKPSYKWMFNHDRKAVLNGIVFDAELAGYLLNSEASDPSLKHLCEAYRIPFKASGERSSIAALPALCDRLQKEIENADMGSLLKDIELPLTEVLAFMETEGVKVDKEGVRSFGDNLIYEIGRAEKEIYEYSGEEFNISSPKQLGEVLFDKLGLPAKKKTKSGYSTNAEVLESLRDKHPIIELILQYRQLTKLNSTYVEGLLKTVRGDGRVHSCFKQTETRTGRISSTEPNMQNIPVRTERGREMRKFFIADEGNVLLDADYSQIELRILAAICGDETMQRAFLTGEDIHTLTASQVFGLPEDMITSDMRRKAKAVNFGIIYGIGAFSLSKDIGVSVAEADRYIKGYLQNYPKADQYMKDAVDKAIKDGYISTLFGRRRYIPELSASNKILQAFGKRAAMNAPIQGSAADVIKIAMVRVFRRLREECPEAKLILQVHDELIVEVPEGLKDKASRILQDEMENAAKLSVPLTAEVKSGRSWFDAKD